jgi:hypothetical protein
MRKSNMAKLKSMAPSLEKSAATAKTPTDSMRMHALADVPKHPSARAGTRNLYHQNFLTSKTDTKYLPVAGSVHGIESSSLSIRITAIGRRNLWAAGRSR